MDASKISVACNYWKNCMNILNIKYIQGGVYQHQEGCCKRWELNQMHAFFNWIFYWYYLKSLCNSMWSAAPLFQPKNSVKITITKSDINKDYSLLDLKNFAFQFLGIFYLVLAVLLVGTNIWKNEEQTPKKKGETIDCVQIIDQGIGTWKMRCRDYICLIPSMSKEHQILYFDDCQ